MYISSVNAYIGKLWLRANETHLLQVSFSPLSGKEKNNKILNQAKIEIIEYMQGKRQEFSVPISFTGSEFQVSVWKNLQLIPYGKVWTYKQLAQYCGNPGASRAAGGASHSNPLPIIVPCHRVISSCDNIGGYVAGRAIKQKLLDMEVMNSL